jgi:hypothetical protein
MKTKLHAMAGGIAMICILSFWLSSVYVELFGSFADVAYVKNSILKGMVILIPAMMAVGGSGFALGGKWKSPVVLRKKKRMKIIAANGILILVPSAFFLAFKAQAGQFDTWFYTVQIIELLAGATNLALLSANMKDGIQMARRKKTRKA